MFGPSVRIVICLSFALGACSSSKGKSGGGGSGGAGGSSAGGTGGIDASTDDVATILDGSPASDTGGAGANGDSGTNLVSCAHPVALNSTVGGTFSDMLVDDSYAYWYEPDNGSGVMTARVAKVPVDGSGPAVDLFNAACGGVAGVSNGFASDANNIYIVCYQVLDATHQVQIMTIPKNGSAPTPLWIRDFAGSVGTNVCASNVGADGTHVYFSDCNTGPELRSIPVGGGAQTPLLPTMPYSPLVNGFAYIKLFGGNAYWQGSLGQLLEAPATGGNPVLLADNNALYGQIDNIVIHDAFFYWRSLTPPAPQALWRLPLTGGTPVELAAIPGYGSAGGQLEIFGSSIYFAEYDGSGANNLILLSYPLEPAAAGDAGVGTPTIIATIPRPAGFSPYAKNHVVANSTHLFISDPASVGNNGHIYRCE